MDHENKKSMRHPADYDTLDMNNKLIVNLRDLGHMLRFLFEGRGSQKRILIVLYENGVMRQSALTRWLGIRPGSASEVIGKLEHAGLVCRTPEKEDRRMINVELTEKGQIQAEQASRERRQRHDEMFSCLTEDEKKCFLELAEKLSEDWERRFSFSDQRGRGCGER